MRRLQRTAGDVVGGEAGQPVAAGIASHAKTFHLYRGGVYDDPDCGSDLNHVVTVIGAGTDNVTGRAYWLIKNSWGDGWGDQGYIKIARDKGNMCGVATRASYPLV